MRNGYDVNHPLIKRRPFISMYLSVVGKYCDPLPNVYDKHVAMLYEPVPQDPNLLSMNSPLEVFIILNVYIFYIIHLFV